MDNNTPLLAVLGGGMANNAGQAIAMRNYNLYVQECQAMGQQPLPPAQWYQQQQATSQQQAAPQGQMPQTQFNNGAPPNNQQQLLNILRQRAMGQGQ